MSLDLDPIKERVEAIRMRYEAAQFYEDPRFQIPVDFDALIAEVERLRKLTQYEVRVLQAPEMSRR